jgi:CRP-like cAMP-binding protein
MWRMRLVPKGQVLVRQGDITTDEFIVLNGKAISHISDSDGRGVCVGLYGNPGIITPHVARTRNTISLVSIEATQDLTIASLGADRLASLMLQSNEIRDWANGVLREELARKTDREWCLAALTGRDRLLWLRDRYPDHETLFSHGNIASFLGMTPVTLSRLRHSK